mgnify:CR=1 FL=1
MPMPSRSHGDEQNRDRVGEAEQRQPRGQHEVGKRQHGAATDQIDLPADARPSMAEMTSDAEKAAKIQFEETPRSRAIGSARIAGR